MQDVFCHCKYPKLVMFCQMNSVTFSNHLKHVERKDAELLMRYFQLSKVIKNIFIWLHL